MRLVVFEVGERPMLGFLTRRGAQPGASRVKFFSWLGSGKEVYPLSFSLERLQSSSLQHTTESESHIRPPSTQREKMYGLVCKES